MVFVEFFSNHFLAKEIKKRCCVQVWVICPHWIEK